VANEASFLLVYFIVFLLTVITEQTAVMIRSTRKSCAIFTSKLDLNSFFSGLGSQGSAGLKTKAHIPLHSLEDMMMT
jgi:hypothetical protein